MRMDFDRFETQADAVRLPGRTEQRGSKMGLPTWGGALFGVPFAAVGAWAVLAGMRVIPVDPKSLHAPYWVLTVFGVVFALGGAMVWGLAWRQHREHRRRQQVPAGSALSRVMSDYGWQPRGYAVPRWSKFIKSLAVALFLTLFLSMFNYWAFAERGPWPVKIIVGIFDLVTLAVWWQTSVVLGRALKFGGSRLDYIDFPYTLGRPAVLRWIPARGIGEARRGQFTLRCVREWYEERGHGKNRTQDLVHERVWSGAWHLDKPRVFQPGMPVEIRYEPPAGLPSTHLSADKPVFWELDVRLDLPGLDFEEIYLVPIYHP